MLQVIVIRDFFEENATLGKCYVKHHNEKVDYIGNSLERGWQDNEKRISCIPVGIYPLKLEYSNKFKKMLWEIYGVSNRRECKFHAANFWKQLNGCIALGKNRTHIDGDGVLDVTSSRNTMKIFHDTMGQATEAILVVKNV